ncbi:MAG TPA: hypothetical protein VFQ88_15165 [Nevskiaceae bacterium]|nr:hypothetical protein [Nevskiaceae bacterium]
MNKTFVFPAPLHHEPDSGDVFSRGDLAFRFFTEHDYDAGAPWDREDGHGPVSDWTHVTGWRPNPTTRYLDRPAGSLILCQDDCSARFYRFAEAMRIAKRDGWGLSALDTARLHDKLGHDPKPGEIREAVVRADFERLRDWCNDRWEYVTVGVRLLDVDGRSTGEAESLGGVESDAGDYLMDVANELAEDIIARVGDAVAEIPARPASFTIRKAA